MVRTVLYTNKASKINCLPCTDLISLTARLDLLPHIMQQIPKDQSNRSTERVIFWSGRRERDVGCSDSYSNITASSKSTGHPGISLVSVPADRYVNGMAMKKEIEKSQIHKTLAVIHLSAGWQRVYRYVIIGFSCLHRDTAHRSADYQWQKLKHSGFLFPDGR